MIIFMSDPVRDVCAARFTNSAALVSEDVPHCSSSRHEAL